MDFPRRAGVVAAVLTTVAVLAGLLLARLAPPSDITVDVVKADGRVAQVLVDPVAARADLPQPYLDKCEAGYPATKPRSCLYGDKRSEQRIALLGDSHAAQWFPPLEQLSKANGWALEVDSKSACSSGDVTQYHPAIKRDYPECQKFREALLRRWENNPSRRPDVVVVANRNELTVTEDGQRLDPLASLEAHQAGLERTFERLAAMDVEVVLVGDVFSLPYDVPDCLSAHTNDPSACDFDAADVAPLLEADRLAARAAGVPVIEPAAAVCSDGRCTVIQNGMVVYRDDHHLTATYARSLAAEFRRELARTSAWKRLQG